MKPETKLERQARLAAEANARTEPRDVCGECWEPVGHHPLCGQYEAPQDAEPIVGQESLL